jgi:hypothetical protein
MRKALLLVVLGCLLAVPLAASEPAATSSSESRASLSRADLVALGILTGAELRQICPQSGMCPPDPCIPEYTNCQNRVYNQINFIKQKPNGKCVYQCLFSEECFDVLCNTNNSIDVDGSHRVRIGPYPVGECPAPDIDFCTGGEWIAEGTE